MCDNFKQKWNANRVIALTNILVVVVMICLVWITYNGIKSSNQATERSNTLLEQQIRVENRAFISIEPEGWRPEERNKDKYTCAYLYLTNYGNKPTRELKVIKDCMVRVTASMTNFKHFKKDTDTLPGSKFDPERERRLKEYYNYRTKPVKELSDYFRNTRFVKLLGMKNKEIQKHFEEKWESNGYKLEVYNPTVSFDFPSLMVNPQQSLRVGVTPSTGRDHEPFVELGGDIIVVFLAIEYRGMTEQAEDIYRTCCIARYDSFLDGSAIIRKDEYGNPLYPLVLRTNWEIEH